MKNNPFQSDANLRFSNYCLSVNRELKSSPRSGKVGQLTLEVFHELQELIADDAYPCTGAQAAFGQEAYRFGVYPELATPEATAGLVHDLFTFQEERRRIDSDFTTFIAVFEGPRKLTEEDFEMRLWQQLQRVHEADAEHHDWARDVARDPQDPDFSFSFARDAYFVVGMHDNASRAARRFPYPALVFNAHEQFERLRETEAYGRMQSVIREREREMTGSVNPMLDDFGSSSEARQYSGRAVDLDWKCPFEPRRAGQKA